jgi:hypothetical protein
MQLWGDYAQTGACARTPLRASSLPPAQGEVVVATLDISVAM